jgi:hypothetical protein
MQIRRRADGPVGESAQLGMIRRVEITAIDRVVEVILRFDQ